MISNFNNFKKINESRTEYTRVIPRDLFNEAKLLKCIGRLCLLIHDNNVPVEMKAHNDGEPFNIEMLSEGSLTISNVDISIKGNTYVFKTTYNSKSNYPLYVVNEYDEYPVFDDNGQFDPEFIEFCNSLS